MVVFLRAVDTTETDTFSVVVVQHFDGVAVEDGDDGAGEVGGRGESRKDEIEEKENWERKQLQQSHTWGNRTWVMD
jgi:hypothetical protein